MSKKHDWSIEAASLPSDEFRLSIPLASILFEATELARFPREHHKADKKTGLPGLGDANVAPSMADDIDSLVAEVSAAQSAYTLTVDPKTDVTKMDRARFIVDEINAVMLEH